jgi:hypothetical protein
MFEATEVTSVDQVKAMFAKGQMDMMTAKKFSRHFGFNMAKVGKDKSTGMGGKWVWFKS